MYDEAMQIPLFEMSGNHNQYIPEMCYYYNKKLPSGDSSTRTKIKKRKIAYEEVLKRSMYKPLNYSLTPQER